MIAKPKDWDTAQAITGERRQVTPGGHICKIVSARTEKSRAGKDMLVIAFDIAEGGELDGIFRAQYEARRKESLSATWPNAGIFRCTLLNNDGKTNGFFKGMIGAVEASNAGFTWDWDEKSLSSKLVGFVFGEEEYMGNDGEIKVNVRAQLARSVEAIEAGVDVPERKKLKPTSAFTQVENEDCPF